MNKDQITSCFLFSFIWFVIGLPLGFVMGLGFESLIPLTILYFSSVVFLLLGVIVENKRQNSASNKPNPTKVD